MRERVLEMSLAECVDFFAGVKYKLYSIDHDAQDEKPGKVRVEIPRYQDESYFVDLPYANDEQLREIESRLRQADFVKQTIRLRSSF